MTIVRAERREDWPALMREIVSAHRDTPFEWGVSDCTFSLDIVLAMTGFDPIADIRGYFSELSALRRLRACGYETAIDLIAANFDAIPVSEAQRGDLVYPETIGHPLMCPAILDGHVAYAKGPGGFVTIPASQLHQAFAV